MKLDPRIKYYTVKEMRTIAQAAVPEEMVKDKRKLTNEFAKRNGYKKTLISISGIRRVYFYKEKKV